MTERYDEVSGARLPEDERGLDRMATEHMRTQNVCECEEVRVERAYIAGYRAAQARIEELQRRIDELTKERQ